MAKKHKNPLNNVNPNDTAKPSIEASNSSNVFNTLFGELNNSASNSIFSDNNPFRRKLLEESETGFPKKDSNLDDSDPKERKEDKLKKESSDLQHQLVELTRKKLKKVELVVNENGGDDDIRVKSEKKKKKRKRDEVEAEYEAKRYGMVIDEVKEGNVGSGVVGEKRKKIENPENTMVEKEGFDDEGKLLRTVFVGNLPLKLKKKELVKEFGKFGEVESVRIRSVPIVDSKIPRKGAVIKKRINENGDSVHAYIVFKTEESAHASLAHNMAVVAGNHIRVDRACPPRKKLKVDESPLYDNKRTIFVGNLPFDVKDEEVYQLFCGIKNLETSIEAVRVIRDPGSSLGKGIAYVLFKTTEAANMVLKKRNLRLRDRELRLSHAKANSMPSKRKDTSPPETNSHPAKRFHRTPDNVDKVKAKTNLSYQGLRATKSGAQKKVHTRTTTSPGKSNSGVTAAQKVTEEKGWKKKRPAVAARKEKARRAASASQLVGTKRKSANRTPASSAQKKKARKFK